MYKIKDRILLGVVAGLIGGIPDRIINALEYNKGLTDLKYGQMVSSFFLPRNKINSREGEIIASLVYNSLLSFAGIITTYVLTNTGRDNAAIKGTGIGILTWISWYGLSQKLGLVIRSRKAIAPILSFIDHVIFGSLCGTLVSRLGDDSLFPDCKVK